MDEVIKHIESGFNFNSKLSIADHNEMKLVDIGTRYKILFVIYGVAYYDSNYISNNKDVIYDSGSTKGLILQFYRGVPLSSIISTFESSILQRNINNSNEVLKNIEYLKVIFRKINNINYKDIIHIIWENKELFLYYNNKLIGNIKSNLFSKIIFQCYLDKDSVIKDFKYI
jgi:hypothetical protein